MPEKNKVVLLGAYGVGKTCILRRFAEGAFESKHTPTIGVDFQNKTVQVGTEAIKLQIWDSAGQERFSAIAPAYFRVHTHSRTISPPSSPPSTIHHHIHADHGTFIPAPYNSPMRL